MLPLRSFRHRFLLVLYGLSLGASLPAFSADAMPAKFWIFLVTGKSAAGVAKEEIQQKQRAHLDNFRRLAEVKRLLAAGPMSDPQRKLRGIVVVQADQPEQISGYFTPDPYVSEGFMQTEIHRLIEQDGEFTVQRDATGLEELRIVVWDRILNGEKPAAISTEALDAHRAYWQALRQAGKLALRCRFADDSPRFGVALVIAAEEETVKKWLDEDPLVQQGCVRFQVMPQYLGKGVVQFSR